MKYSLFVTKQCRRLTLWGWLVLLLLLALVFRMWLGTVCRWLSLSEPVPAKTLVVEGWIEDYARMPWTFTGRTTTDTWWLPGCP